MTNITELPGPDLNEMEAGLLHFKENLTTILEYNQIAAQLMRCKYNALIDEGFNPEQALVLCKL
jgi:hypothetical protein